MITESEATELLARAADTIPAPPDRPLSLVAAPRPRWVAPAAAAAAIAAAVATGLALANNHDRPDHPGPVAPTPTSDRFVGSVPPVFAYDADSAQTMLEKRGLRVRREEVVSQHCVAPNRAVLTEPGVGFPVSPGDTVTLMVSGPLPNSCDPSTLLAWQILDYANGRGAEPRFATDASFYLNGEKTALPKVAEVLAHETWYAENALTASLRVRQLSAPESCAASPGAFPPRFISRRSFGMRLVVPGDGIVSTCRSTHVFTNASGEIDGIVVEAPPFLTEPPEPIPTDRAEQVAVRGPAGHFINFARGWMQRPAFARSVRLYNDGSLIATLDSRRARDRSAYQLCPDSAHHEQCELSPVELVGHLRAAPTVSLRADCFDGTGILPHVSGQATVLISDAGLPPCESSWVVQLEYNDDYEIVAVNEFEGPN